MAAVVGEHQVLQDLELHLGARHAGGTAHGAIEHQRAEHDVADQRAGLSHLEVRLIAVRLELADVMQQHAGHHEVAVCPGHPARGPRNGRDLGGVLEEPAQEAMVPGQAGRAEFVLRAELGVGVEEVQHRAQTGPTNLAAPAVQDLPVRGGIADGREQVPRVHQGLRQDPQRAHLELPPLPVELHLADDLCHLTFPHPGHQVLLAGPERRRGDPAAGVPEGQDRVRRVPGAPGLHVEHQERILNPCAGGEIGEGDRGSHAANITIGCDYRLEGPPTRREGRQLVSPAASGRHLVAHRRSSG